MSTCKNEKKCVPVLAILLFFLASVVFFAAFVLKSIIPFAQQTAPIVQSMAQDCMSGYMETGLILVYLYEFAAMGLFSVALAAPFALLSLFSFAFAFVALLRRNKALSIILSALFVKLGGYFIEAHLGLYAYVGFLLFILALIIFSYAPIFFFVFLIILFCIGIFALSQIAVDVALLVVAALSLTLSITGAINKKGAKKFAKVVRIIFYAFVGLFVFLSFGYVFMHCVAPSFLSFLSFISNSVTLNDMLNGISYPGNYYYYVYFDLFFYSLSAVFDAITSFLYLLTAIVATAAYLFFGVSLVVQQIGKAKADKKQANADKDNPVFLDNSTDFT